MLSFDDVTQTLSVTLGPDANLHHDFDLAAPGS